MQPGYITCLNISARKLQSEDSTDFQLWMFHRCPRRGLFFGWELLMYLRIPFQKSQVFGKHELCLTGLLSSVIPSPVPNTREEPVRGEEALAETCLLSGMADSQAPP